MENTPDISKIIGVIMQNPSLISEIAALANKPAETEPSTDATEAPMIEEAAKPASEETAATPPKRRPPRKELLNAMKPYLSEKRRGALDSVASIFDILDVMMRKET
jgi:hypothetical protein